MVEKTRVWEVEGLNSDLENFFREMSIELGQNSHSHMDYEAPLVRRVFRYSTLHFADTWGDTLPFTILWKSRFSDRPFRVR